MKGKGETQRASPLLFIGSYHHHSHKLLVSAMKFNVVKLEFYQLSSKKQSDFEMLGG